MGWTGSTLESIVNFSRVTTNGLRGGQPEIATALPYQPVSVAHQQPDSDTVHAIHLPIFTCSTI